MATFGGGEIIEYNFTFAWGVNPSNATGVVAVPDGGSFPYGEGDYVAFQFGVVAVFYGIISEIVEMAEGNGSLVRFTVVDNRVRLQWQVVTGAWNMPDPRPANRMARPAPDSGSLSSTSSGPTGTNDVSFGGSAPSLDSSDGVGSPGAPANPQGMTRQYAHLLPENAAAGIWTYTDEPLTAQQIINSAMGGAWGQYAFSRSYHSSMASATPMGVDASDGVKISNFLSSILETVGMEMRISGANSLVFDRKGGLPLVIPSIATTRKSIGAAITANDTAVMVVGDSNVVQCINVELEPDWARSWEAYVDELAWIREVAATFSLPAGTKDEQAELVARAREVTVVDYVKAKGEASFADYGSFGNIARMSLPAWIYIRELVFRAYRIPADYQWGGIPLDSLRMASGLLVATSVDGTGPTAKQKYRTDSKEFYPGAQVQAIIKGQPIDLIDSRSIATFLSKRSRDLRSEWMEISDFEVDAARAAIRFRTPVFIDGDSAAGEALYLYPNKGEGGGSDISGSVSGDSSLLDIVVPNPGYQIEPAEVKISVAWEIGKFRYSRGTSARCGVHKMSGLSIHAIDTTDGGFADSSVASLQPDFLYLPSGAGVSLSEILLEGGSSAVAVADAAAESATSLSAVQESGSYTRRGVVGTALSSVVDRVTVMVDDEGLAETVEMTKASATRAFVAERTFSRVQRTSELYLGQAAHREEIRSLRLEASLLRGQGRDKSGDTHRTLDDARGQPIGANYSATEKYVMSSADYTAAFPDGLAVGSLVWLGDEGVPAKDGKAFGGVVIAAPPTVESGVVAIRCAKNGTVPVRLEKGVLAAVKAEPGDITGSAKGSFHVGRYQHAEEMPDTGSEDGSKALGMVELGAAVAGDGRLRPYLVKVEDEWMLRATPGTATFIDLGSGSLLTDDDVFNDFDIEIEHHDPVFPLIKDKGIDDDDPPGFALEERTDGALYVVYKTDCKEIDPEDVKTRPARLELVARGEKPEVKKNEIFRLLSEFDFETPEGSAGDVKLVNAVYYVLSDVDIIGRCGEGDSSSLDPSGSDPDSDGSGSGSDPLSDSDSGSGDPTSDSGSDGGDCEFEFRVVKWVWGKNGRPDCLNKTRDYVIGVEVRINASAVWAPNCIWHAKVGVLGGDNIPFESAGQSGSAGLISVRMTSSTVTVQIRAKFRAPAPACEELKVIGYLEASPDPDELDDTGCDVTYGPCEEVVGVWPRFCGSSACSKST